MSNAPSAARLQHADAIEAPQVDTGAFRQGWRVHTRLDALHRDGRITAGQWQAAVEYRAAHERVSIAAAYAGSGELLRVSGGGAGGGTDGRLAGVADTMKRLRKTDAAIGRFDAALCSACILVDRPWAEIARVIGHNPETIRDWTARAIGRLAAAWSLQTARRRWDGSSVRPEAHRPVAPS